LQNTTAWASLTAAPAAEAAAPAEEGDDLWTEFQGREAQQRQAEVQRKVLEEEERKKKEAQAQALRKQAEEVRDEIFLVYFFSSSFFSRSVGEWDV
jgi:hypothetical protein